MQHNSRGGFLPLMAIIAIAVIVAAGTTAAVMLHHRKVEKQPEPVAAPAPEGVVGQGSARVASSSPESAREPDRQSSTAVEARVAEEGTEEQSREEDERERRERAAQLEARQRAMDEELQRAHAEHRAIVEGSDGNYDDAKCRQQKKSLLSRADATYLQWWDDYQEARGGMDSCYDTNSVPVCDKRMTELNVAWQARLDARFEPLYAQLTSCRSGDREFGSISTVVSAGY